MPRKADAPTYDETKHYGGDVIVRFYPKAHFYKVWDPKRTIIKNGKEVPAPLDGVRMGGATSLTGTMDKGMGLMMYPMYEMKKYLDKFFETTTVKELVDNPLTIADILKSGTDAHVKKSDRGKSVGTDAHAWVEQYLIALRDGKEAPAIPEVEDIAAVLKRRYVEIIKDLKPKAADEYRQLPKLIMQDIDIQESINIEAIMVRKSIVAAKAWFDLHEITVFGCESPVYSRELQVCGMYDADLQVKCTKKCGWCYRNGDTELPEDDFIGRYITDFKTTNTSSSAPKGIYDSYLAQCGVYDVGLTEEFPERIYDGHLILNASKHDGSFNSHFSFNRERNRRWARCLAAMKEFIFQGKKEITESK